MLVLTRRIDESLTIGDSITITVLGIEGDKVKLGIKAPREITILRQEIYDAGTEQIGTIPCFTS
jgi:carbon storage regulator